MNKRVTGLTLCAVLFALCLAAEAQQLTKSARVGYLDDGTAAGNAELIASFRQQMRQLGWVEGENLAVEYRFGDGQGAKRLEELALDLVRLKPDVLVVSATSATLAAKKATSTIPIVMTTTGDPVGDGIVTSLARPGGNITGLATLTRELGGKRVEILKEVVPRATLIGVLMGSRKGPGGQRQVKSMKAAASALGVRLEEFGATGTAEESEKAFRSLARDRFHAFITTSGPEIFAVRKRIVELAGKYRLPGIYPEKEFVAEGGLLFYGIDRPGQFARAAVYVDKILKGAKPADLPVEQPKKFEFVVNLKTANEIGMTIPPSVLARADRVIR